MLLGGGLGLPLGPQLRVSWVGYHADVVPWPLVPPSTRTATCAVHIPRVPPRGLGFCSGLSFACFSTTFPFPVSVPTDPVLRAAVPRATLPTCHLTHVPPGPGHAALPRQETEREDHQGKGGQC